MEKDVKWSTFFEDKHRYADIINGIGCLGMQIVSDKDLTEVDTRLGTKRRDLVRKTAFGMNFAIIGIENQDETDYELPVRIMNYDAMHYKKQVSKISRKVKANAKGLEPGEYMYGFLKDSKLFPVITFILYAGTEPWKGSERLHDMIDFTDIPASLKNMISDYKIHVIDIRRLNDTSIFKTDVRDVYEVISTYANTKGIVKMEQYKNEIGGIDMCKGIRDLINDSKKEGIKEGITKKQNNIIVKMLKKGMPMADICEITECDMAYVEQIRQSM